MELDEDGFPQPTGELEELEADSLVLALGQESDLSLLDASPGSSCTTAWSQVGADLMTGHAGIFAGGDIVPAERTVTTAIGHGRTAAAHIDAWLRGAPPRAAAAGRARDLRQAQHLVLHRRARRRCARTWTRARRESTFDEVVGGLDEETALFEARRCLSCGTASPATTATASAPTTPSSSSTRRGPTRTPIDLDFCKGCGICAQECPCGAIEMRPETV